MDSWLPEQSTPRWSTFVRCWFRPRVYGLDRIPAGPCLLVANHGIAAPWELLVVRQLWRWCHPTVRLRIMTHRIWEGTGPGWRRLRQWGCIPATESAALAALAAGDAVLVFPGGTREETRPFWQWARTQFSGRLGWARIAARARVPVVPLALLGSQLVNPPLLQWRGWAWLSGVRLLGVRDMPLTLAQLLGALFALAVLLRWLPVWGAAALAWFVLWSPLLVFLPLLPVRLQVAAGEPLPPPATATLPDLQGTYATVQERITGLLAGLRRTR